MPQALTNSRVDFIFFYLVSSYVTLALTFRTKLNESKTFGLQLYTITQKAFLFSVFCYIFLTAYIHILLWGYGSAFGSFYFFANVPSSFEINLAQTETNHHKGNIIWYKTEQFYKIYFTSRRKKDILSIYYLYMQKFRVYVPIYIKHITQTQLMVVVTTRRGHLSGMFHYASVSV